MRILQINAVYEILSTGRNVKEIHEYLLKHGEKSYIACPELKINSENFYRIGNKAEHKMHAVLSRLTGLQGYYSKRATRKLLKHIKKIKPDVILLHNLHSNYINFIELLEGVSNLKIPVIFILHDCWFFTGKCVHYSEDNCFGWKSLCGGKCPALKKGNISWFFDKSRKMISDKKKVYQILTDYAVVGVSKWVTEDAKKSILKNAEKFRCIYNWIDLDIFKFDEGGLEKRKKYRIEDKFIILGVAAKWNEQKGISIFTEIADLLGEDSVIVLVGESDKIMKKNNIINIERTDSVSELVSWYSAADVLLNPSLQETFGKTTAEALSCGLPVVGYQKTATIELIGTDGSCGIAVNTLNAGDYLKAVILIKEKGKAHYKHACRKRAELLFDRDKNIGLYYSLMKYMTKENRDRKGQIC